MAEIRPFRAIRYSKELIDSGEQVVAPPYDVLSSEEQLFLYQQSRYNVIRLEYGITYPDDNACYNCYSRAAQTMASWLAEGILLPDENKKLYLYEQFFRYEKIQYCRRGVFAALRVENYDSGNILPHEQTLSAPKADRLELLKYTKTNISPIFTLFPDPEGYISGLLNTISGTDPLFALEDQSGQKHRVTGIDDPALQDEIMKFMRPRALLIADGHHRYETAQHYMGLRENKADSAANYILAILVSMKEQGLLLLPTHRLISKLSGKASKKLIDICKINFTLTPLNCAKNVSEKIFHEEWKKITRTENAFAIITPERHALLIPKAETGKNKLAVQLLHESIIEPFFKLSEVTAEVKNSLIYPHDFANAQNMVHDGTGDSVAFILDPVSVDEVYNRALQGEVMPQKTTFFYPKLPGGLLMRNLDRD